MNTEKKIAITLAIICAILVTIVSATATDFTIDNWAYWSMDDANTSGTTVYDETGNYNGTLSGGVTTGVSGEIEEAHNYDGNDDEFDTTTTIGITGSTDRSMFGWVKTTISAGDLKFFGWGNNANQEQFRLMASGAIGWKFWGYFEDCDADDAGEEIDDNIWHHIGVTLGNSGTNVTIWKDGLEVNSCTVTALTSVDTDFEIGHQGGGQNLNFSVDEVGLWNRTFSHAEVNELYNLGKSPYSPSPENFSITAINNFGETLNEFNATIDGITYTTTNGTIITPIQTDSTTLFNITGTANYHYERNFTNINVSTNYQMELQNNSIQYLRIEIWNYWNTSLIQDVTIEINGTNYTSNPYLEDVANYVTWLNQTANLSIKAWDNDNLHRNYINTFTINTTSKTINISMLANQLMLYFQTGFNGTSKAVEGTISDQEKRLDFNDTELLVFQKNLTEGIVHVTIDTTTLTGDNGTQFYEYINYYDTHINESIEILTGDTTYATLTIKDLNGVVGNAKVRIEYGTYIGFAGIWWNFRLLGQRLTTTQGKANFWIPEGGTLLVTISKTGYETKILKFNYADEILSQEEGVTIYINEDVSIEGSPIQVYTPEKVYTKTENINGTIVYGGSLTISYTTAYRITQGLGTKTTQGDLLGRYNIELESDTDFSSLTSDNITIYIYTNGTLAKNKNNRIRQRNKNRTIRPKRTRTKQQTTKLGATNSNTNTNNNTKNNDRIRHNRKNNIPMGNSTSRNTKHRIPMVNIHNSIILLHKSNKKSNRGIK